MAVGHFYIAYDFRNFAVNTTTNAPVVNYNTSLDLPDYGSTFVPDYIFMKQTGNAPQWVFGDNFAQSGPDYTDGQIKTFRDGSKSAENFYLTELSTPLSAMSYVNSPHTPANDIAFLRQMLAGDDKVTFEGVTMGLTDSNYAFFGTGDDTVFGSIGDDTLLGERGNDRILGDEGEDSLVGGKGEDTLLGQQDDDKLKGNTGDDRLRGGSGEDRLYGGRGNDNLKGGSGDDFMKGQSNNDYMHGGSGNDTVIGGSGDDRVMGKRGDDVLRGGSGNDTIDGSTGNDVLKGNSGADRFVFKADAGNDTIIDFKDGVDQIRFLGEAGQNINVDVDYSGANAVVRFFDGTDSLDTRIVLLNVDNDILQLSTSGLNVTLF